MSNLSWQSLITAAAVIGAILTAYNLIMSAVKNHREQKAVSSQPITALKTDVESMKQCLDRDKRKLEEHDNDIKQTRDGMNVIVRANLAMLRHMQHGNNVDGLRDSETEINEYLTRR